jgi:hypothetical protein
MPKAERMGKVFIDWSQNATHKTTAAVYSMRAANNEPLVSMPVTWTELEDAVVEQDRFRLCFPPNDALKRLSRIGDLFAPVLTLTQGMPAGFHSVAEPGASAPKKKPQQRFHSTTNIPKRSGQGSRRFYVLEQQASGAVLHLDIGDSFRSWRIPLALGKAPKQVGAGKMPKQLTVPKQLIAEENRAPNFRRLCDSWAVEAEQGHLSPVQLEKQLAKGVLPGFLDLGNFELIEGSDAAGQLRFVLTGKLLFGEFVLCRLRPGRWKLVREEDWAGGRRSGVHQNTLCEVSS